MHVDLMVLLQLAEGPLFRFSFALLVLGAVRAMLLAASDVVGGWVTITDRGAFWRRLRLHVLWLVFPSLLLRRIGPPRSFRSHLYHDLLCVTSLLFRFTAILVPAFMVAHVYLWEQGLGLSWPTLPARIADVLALATIVSGLALFLGRLYSPVLRKLEPPWAFLKPLILIVPFLTGTLAMHPTWSPVDYYVVRLLHVVSGAVVFAMVPFARMLTFMHWPLARVVPEANWQAREGPAPGAAPAVP